MALTNLSAHPAGLMRASDSRPSILVSPSATSAAYRIVAVIFHISARARLPSCSQSGHFAPAEKAFGIIHSTVGPPVLVRCRALPNRGHLLAVLDNMTPVSSTSSSVASCCLADGSGGQTTSFAIAPRFALPVSSPTHHCACQRLHPQHHQHTSRRLPRPSCSLSLEP
jgi:hypothetical protein